MTKTLPIIPMRSSVLFPGMSLPISAGRPQTLKAIEAALRDPEHRVFAVAQRGDAEGVTPESLYTIGTIATISSVQRGLGGVRLVLEGHERAVAVRVVSSGDYLAATITDAVELPPLDAKDASFVALHREVRDRSAELAVKRGVPEEAVEQLLAQATEPGRLADLVAGYLDIPAPERQALLEALAIEDRLRRVLIHIQRQLEVASAQEKIQSK